MIKPTVGHWKSWRSALHQGKAVHSDQVRMLLCNAGHHILRARSF